MAQDARIGSELGGYKLVRVLGRGGMGAVYEALEPATGRRLALKLLHVASLEDGSDSAGRFQREAEGAARVDHRNVARVHQFGRDPRTGEPFIVSELLTGGSLHDRLKKTGPLPWREAAKLGAQIARGLEAIHAAGLVHRDLKPANVLLTHERAEEGDKGRAKITDFGLVRLGGAERLTRTGEIMGTPEFCAPEQADSAKHADPPADLYSLGATLHALVTGDPPFRGSITELLMQVLNDQPTPLRKLVPEVPRELEALVLHLLSKKPDERPTASEAARELEAIAEGKVSRRSRGAWIAVAAVAVVSLAAGLWAAFGRGSKEETPSKIESSAAKATPPPTPNKAPAWYLALKPAERPASLPKGISFGKLEGEYLNEVDGSSLRFVAAGRFTTGSPETAALIANVGRPEESRVLPVQEVNLLAYFIGTYEVTVDQFRQFARRPPRYKTDAERLGNGNVLGLGGWEEHVPRVWFEHPDAPESVSEPREPVSQVSWNDAAAYCKWAKLRLPTEAEWERAALFDAEKKVKRLYAWGNDAPGTEEGKKPANVRDETVARAWPVEHPIHFTGYEDGFLRRAPAGSFPDGASPVGALDMTGNVAEWVEDVYDRSSTVNEPDRAFRGGGWGDHWWGMYGAERDHAGPEYHSNDLGFRVARSYP